MSDYDAKGWVGADNWIVQALTAAHAERDALAARLATLTAAGITTGEDGEPRFHGLTGAEIEAMRAALRFYADESNWLTDDGICMDNLRGGYYCGSEQVDYDFDKDNGARARRALAAAPPPASE